MVHQSKGGKKGKKNGSHQRKEEGKKTKKKSITDPIVTIEKSRSREHKIDSHVDGSSFSTHPFFSSQVIT